jgi:hypothetical protein
LALAPLRNPALWAWPIAACLIALGPYRSEGPEDAVAHYYLPALGLLLLGCVPSFFRPQPRRAESAPPLLPRRVLLWLTLWVLVVATAVRLWRILEWPPEGIGFEEFQIAARGHLGPGLLRNLITAYSPPGEHALTAYTISLAFALVGSGFIELRLPFILAGILCVFLFYAVCRRLVSWEVSLFAVALFGVSWWQIAASRVADEIFLPIWVELALLWLLLEFEDTGRTWAGFFLALLSGLLFYEYTSYHLALAMVLGYFAVRLLLFAARLLWRTAAADRRRVLWAGVRTYGPGAIAMVLVWITVAQFQLIRDIRLGMGSWAAGGVGGHAQDADGLLMQLRSPATLPAFLMRRLEIPLRTAYEPGHGGYCLHLGIGSHYGAFDMATAIALGVGILLVTATIWRRFHALALVWAGLIVAGAALLPENLNPHRYYTGVPLFYLLIALGAEVLWRMFRRPAARYVLLAVFAGTVGYAAVANFHYLFWRMIPDPTLTLSWQWQRTEVARWIRAHRRDDWICLVANDDREIEGANPVQPEWQWLVDGWNVRVSEWGTDCIPAPEYVPGGLYYVFAQPAPAVDVEALLRFHYPRAKETAPIELPGRKFTARTFYVPPPTTEVLRETGRAAAP